MISEDDQTDLRPAGWNIRDVMHYQSSRAGGGLMQRSTGSTEPGILVTIAGTYPGEEEECTLRFLITIEQLFGFLAQLEHAGKTAMLLNLP